MKAFIPSCLVASFPLLALSGALIAQTFYDDPKWQAQAEARKRIEKIKNEIKTLNGHPWAGAYYEGTGFGRNVSFYIAPKAGFVFECGGDMGFVDRNYGAVSFENGLVRINPVFPNTWEGLGGIAVEFLPVAWGERHYLVPPDEIVGFCNDINYGREPRSSPNGFSLLRRGDEEIAVTGHPDLPEKYRAYILEKPVMATVISVGESGTETDKYTTYNLTTATISAGSNQGLLPGMRMYLVNPPRNEKGGWVQTGSIDIVEVGESSAKVLVRCSGKYERAPQTGWQLATCPDYVSALKKYGAYILENPVSATVISVGKSKTETSKGKYVTTTYILTTATINAGSKQGLLPDMQMYLVKAPGSRVQTGFIKIVEVAETSATVLVRRVANSNNEHETSTTVLVRGVKVPVRRIASSKNEQQAPQVGWQLTTEPRYARAAKKNAFW